MLERGVVPLHRRRNHLLETPQLLGVAVDAILDQFKLIEAFHEQLVQISFARKPVY
jgi:hypothetical protein